MADQAQEIQDVLADASRTQFAAMSAAVGFWSSWAESAATYSRSVADEFTKLSVEGDKSGEVVGRITDLNREYLRQLTELPNVAVQRFNEEIEKIEKQRRPRSSGSSKPRRRAAKAKP